MNDEIVIERRFRGPPDSGNGGYACGALAKHLDGCAEVTLKAPPPLDKALHVAASEDGATLFDGENPVASARKAELDLDTLDAPSFAEATEAAKEYAGLHDHLLPGCFVCGTEREEGDGLRIFAGPGASRSFVAAPWTPDPSLANGDGVVGPEFIWAALDCPSYFGLMKPGLTALLGRMTAEISSVARVGENYVIVGWPLSEDGRKHLAASALYSESGELIGKAKATWIALDPSQMPG